MPECCVPCPAADPCALSAGIKSGLRDGKPIDGKQESPCPCRSCCCGKLPIVKPCYKQPKIPDSYAPRRCYMKPSAPVESCTTYKLSYLPVDGCKNLRGEARKPSPNLVPSCEPMEGCTVQKMSYLPNPVCITQSIRPCHHDMWGQGPMQNITTQRHDYVAKPCVLRESFKPAPKFHAIEQPFENRTINKLSYVPPERMAPTKSFAPERCYEKPAAKMDSCTTHKMSFMPNQVLTALSFFATGSYQKPVGMSYLHGLSQASVSNSLNEVTKALNSREILMKHIRFPQSRQERQVIIDGFSTKFGFPGCVGCIDCTHVALIQPNDHPERFFNRKHYHSRNVQIILPKESVPWACKGQYQKPCQKLDTSTTYTMSYLEAGSDCRRRAIIPDSCTNPVTASKRFETQTIYKNSYMPATTPIPQPVKPAPNLVPSTAQMEGDTVQKLSYLPNPVCITQSIRPCHHDMWGQGPMQNITTQRHDYVAKPAAIRESFKPANKYHCVEQPFENRTINRMSYINPGRIPVPESYAPLKCYEKPAAKMESNTTQKMSYQPVCVPAPQRPPWACKGQYQKPCQRLEGTTVYKSSFMPPGEDCTQYMDPCSYGDCKPCDCICPAECIATDPCACNFPKAACCS